MQAGNYIHRLQMTVREQAEQLANVREAYEELVGYLLSPKFHENTRVEVRDVLNRLQPVNYNTMGPEPKLVRELTKAVVVTGEVTSL